MVSNPISFRYLRYFFRQRPAFWRALIFREIWRWFIFDFACYNLRHKRMCIVLSNLLDWCAGSVHVNTERYNFGHSDYIGDIYCDGIVRWRYCRQRRNGRHTWCVQWIGSILELFARPLWLRFTQFIWGHRTGVDIWATHLCWMLCRHAIIGIGQSRFSTESLPGKIIFNIQFRPTW